MVCLLLVDYARLLSDVLMVFYESVSMDVEIVSLPLIRIIYYTWAQCLDLSQKKMIVF
jgi:hypothetical protein